MQFRNRYVHVYASLSVVWHLCCRWCQGAIVRYAYGQPSQAYVKSRLDWALDTACP